jgi:large repetitive protein
MPSRVSMISGRSARRVHHPAGVVGVLATVLALVLIACPGSAHAAVFNPIVDTYTRSDCASCNFGTTNPLREDLYAPNGISQAYLKFNLQGLQAPVASATLRVLGVATSDGSTAPIQLRSVADTTWTETGMTYKNQPPMGSVVSTSPSFAAGTWVGMNATSLITGNGLVSMGITASDPNLARKEASREDTGGGAPQLVIPPTVTLASPNSGAWTGPTPTFSGAAGTAGGVAGVAAADLPAVTVKIYAGTTVGGTPVQTLTATQSGGAWSVAASSLADGTYTAQASQADAAGNTGASAPQTFTVDTRPPALTLTAPSPGATTGPEPVVSGAAGTASGDSTTVMVYIYSGTSTTGAPAQTLTATASNGAWSVIPATPLSDQSTYTVVASQTDAAGNITTTAPDTFSIDATPPAVTMTSPANGSITSASGETFSGAAGTARGDAPTVTVSVYAGATASGPPVKTLTTSQSGGAWSVAASGLADGTYTAQASQADAAGNVGISAASTFTVDTTPPAVTLTSPANHAALNTSSPSFSGAAGTASGDSPTVTVNIYAGGDTSGPLVQQLRSAQSSGSWVAAPSKALSDGTYTAQAVQTDEVNNVGSSAPRTFTVDTVAPTVTLTQPAPGSTSGATPTFSGTAGTAPGDSSQVTVNLYAGTAASGTPVQTLTATRDASGSWSATAAPVPNGTFTAQAVQSDAAGNVGTTPATTFTAAGAGVSLDQPADGSVLATATPTFSGHAADTSGSLPTVTVNVYSGSTVAGSPVASMTATESGGTWSVVPQAPLPNGTLTAQATQTDSAGDVGASAPRTFTVVTTPPSPTVTSPASGAWVATSTPTLSGTAGTDAVDNPSVTVSIYAGQTASGSPAQTLTAAANGGSWSVKPRSLPDGAYAVTVSQSDEAGNVGTSPATTFTVDTTPPSVTVASPTGGTVIASSRPVLSGRAGVATGDSTTITVRIYAGNSATGTPLQNLTTTASSGAWSTSPSSALADGTYTVQATQADAAGNISSSSPQTFVVDTTPPAVTLTAPVKGAYVPTSTPALSGAAGSAPGDANTVTVNLYPGATPSGSPSQTLNAPVSGGSWSVRPTAGLADGTWTAQAVQFDWAGNRTSTTPTTFTVDTTPPAVTLTSPSSGAAVNTAVPTFSGAVGARPGDGASVSVSVYSGASATGTPVETLTAALSGSSWSVSASPSLSDGTYTAQASQTDAAGNVGRSSATFTVDTTPPAVTLTSPAAGTVNVSKPTFSGAAGTAPGDFSTIAVQVFTGTSATGTAVQSLSAAASGAAWSVTATGPLADGTYTARATQQDSAGNTGTSTRTFTIDTATPVVSVSSPSAGATVAASASITGTAATAPIDQPTVTINVYPGAAASGTPWETLTANVGPTGSWSVTPPNVFAEGQYTVQASQADSAGNVGTSAATTFTASAPTVDAAGDIACDPNDSNYNGGNGNASGCQEKATTALLKGADRVLALGDLQYDNATTADFQQVYIPTWGAYKSITIPTVGNHEYMSPDGVAAPYYSYFGAAAGDPSKGYYSTNIGNWHVISLNSNCTAVGGCQAGSPQELWLKSDLAAHPAACTMALWHAPRFSSASSGSDSTYQAFWQDLYNANADLILVGHMHNYERFAPQTATGALDTARGIREFVVGTGGRALVPFTSVLPNSEVRNSTTFGVLQLRLHANSYDWKFLPIAGSTVTDSGTQTCH